MTSSARRASRTVRVCGPCTAISTAPIGRPCRCAGIERGDAGEAGAQADHAVAVGGDAHRAADVVAMGDGADAGRRRRSRAAARAARRHRRVARIERAAVQGVVGEDAHREGRRIGAADDDRAGVLEVGDDRAVLLGDEVLERDHAVVGRQAGLVDVDLGRHRHAVQRRQGMAARAGGVGGLGGGARLRLEHAHDGVDRGIDRMQALQDRVDGLASRGLAGADEAGEIGRVVLPEFHAGSFTSRSVRGVQGSAGLWLAHDHDAGREATLPAHEAFFDSMPKKIMLPSRSATSKSRRP